MTAFIGATLIDGTGAAPIRDSAILVRDGRIAWVGPTADLPPDESVRRVDVTGKHVIPGLMDANVHHVLHLDPEVVLRYDPGCYDELILEAAQVALRVGITTVFDTWGPLEALRRVRDRIAAGDVVGPRILLAGNIIGNGGPWSVDFDFLSRPPSVSSEVIAAINRHWEQGVGEDLPWMPAGGVRQAVRDYIATSGIDFVKYAASAHGPKKFIAFSPDAQRAIVEEAHDAGLTVQACTMTPESLKLAIEAGVDLLQHGNSTGLYPMPRETVDLIAARELPCAVLLYTERYRAASDGVVRNGEFTRESERMVTMIDNTRALIEAGAKLVMASDAGVFGPTADSSPFWSSILSDLPDAPYRLETAHVLWLRSAIECGMAPMDALLGATRNVAEAYGKLDELGTLEPGKRADLLVLDTDPLADPANYERITYVVKDGEVVDRDRLPEHRVLT